MVDPIPGTAGGGQNERCPGDDNRRAKKNYSSCVACGAAGLLCRGCWAGIECCEESYQLFVRRTRQISRAGAACCCRPRCWLAGGMTHQGRGALGHGWRRFRGIISTRLTSRRRHDPKGPDSPRELPLDLRRDFIRGFAKSALRVACRWENLRSHTRKLPHLQPGARPDVYSAKDRGAESGPSASFGAGLVGRDLLVRQRKPTRRRGDCSPPGGPTLHHLGRGGPSRQKSGRYCETDQPVAAESSTDRSRPRATEGAREMRRSAGFLGRPAREKRHTGEDMSCEPSPGDPRILEQTWKTARTRIIACETMRQRLSFRCLRGLSFSIRGPRRSPPRPTDPGRSRRIWSKANFSPCSTGTGWQPPFGRRFQNLSIRSGWAGGFMYGDPGNAGQRPGDCGPRQRPGTVHYVFDYSPDRNILEIVGPRPIFISAGSSRGSVRGCPQWRLGPR